MRYRKKFGGILLGCLSGSVGATVIDTTHGAASFATPFGELNTATYGQTFSVGTPAARLKNFSFFIDDYVNPDYVQFNAYVYAWDGQKAVGDPLFESAALSTTNNGGAGGYEHISVETGGEELIAGQSYVALLSASNLFNGIIGTGRLLSTSSDVYADGQFVFLNNGSEFSWITEKTWNRWPIDLAFQLTFDVPEPGTLLLFGAGLLGLGLAHRKRQAAVSA